MSISFASPPRILRTSSPEIGKTSSELPRGANSDSTPPSQPFLQRGRQGSHSSIKSNLSDTANRRPRSPEHLRFEKRVSFSTLDNEEAAMVSFTLKTKHEAHQYSRRSRAFLIGFNDDEYSTSAMEWLIDTMADDGDEIIALRVVDSKFSLQSDDMEEIYREKARSIQKQIIKINEDDKEISIVVELAVGNVKSLLLRLIHLYHPDSLIVGTKGRSMNGLSGLRPNSISKWCLQNSPIPVIVVRPDRKRNKAKEKRLQDPNRRSYLEIIENSASFENLSLSQGNRSFSSSKLNQDIAPDAAVTSPPAINEPPAALSSRDNRHSLGTERSPRGKSPLGKITSRVSRVFGD